MAVRASTTTAAAAAAALLILTVTRVWPALDSSCLIKNSESDQKQQTSGVRSLSQCRSIMEKYFRILDTTDPEITQGAPIMMHTLEAAANGCGQYVGYQWHKPPSIPLQWNPANNTAKEQLVHMYTTNISSMAASFVVASALATKKDLSRLRILFWLPTSEYKVYKEKGGPFLWPDCPRHVSVLEYDMAKEANGTVMERRAQNLPGQVATDPRFTTDAIRYILLYKYGGLWVDTDSLFVKDYDYLFQVQFPGYDYNGHRRMNGAMMQFYKGSAAIRAMIEEAAATNRYGPYDGFKGMWQYFWDDFNKKQSVARDKANYFPRDRFEVETLPKGFRKDCRFFDNLDELYNTTENNMLPWYQSLDLFGVQDATHLIVHTHNECKEQSKWKTRDNTRSVFRTLLDLYLQSIQQYPYCSVDNTSN